MAGGISYGDRPLILGVDPGLSGAIAFYNMATKKLAVFDIPLTVDTKSKNEGRKQVDLMALNTIVDSFAKETILCCAEDVHGMTYKTREGEIRGQGTVQSFNFGKATGGILGVIAAYYIPTIPIRPSVWKTMMNLGSDKKESLAKATKFFPDMKQYFFRAKDDGRAEAALLAVFGAERFYGVKHK